MQLVQPAAWSRCHETEVVRHLDEDERGILERRGEIGERICVVCRIDDILRRTVCLPRDLRETLGDRLDVRGFRVQPRADGCAAHVDRVDRALDNARALHAAAHGGGIGAHLLPERDGDSILQMRTPHLEDTAIGDSFLFQFGRKTVERGEEIVPLL